MDRAPIYLHHEEGRRFVIYFGAVFFAGLAVFCVVQDAPWWMYPFVLIPLFALIWMVFDNPRSGSALDSEQLHIYSGRVSETVKLSDIDSVRMINWGDGGPSAEIKKRDGDRVFVNSSCISGGLKFTEALQSVGVTVVQD